MHQSSKNGSTGWPSIVAGPARRRERRQLHRRASAAGRSARRRRPTPGCSARARSCASRYSRGGDRLPGADDLGRPLRSSGPALGEQRPLRGIALGERDRRSTARSGRRRRRRGLDEIPARAPAPRPRARKHARTSGSTGAKPRSAEHATRSRGRRRARRPSSRSPADGRQVVGGRRPGHHRASEREVADRARERAVDRQRAPAAEARAPSGTRPNVGLSPRSRRTTPGCGSSRRRRSRARAGPSRPRPPPPSRRSTRPACARATTGCGSGRTASLSVIPR